jgi:hypothetical protein
MVGVFLFNFPISSNTSTPQLISVAGFRLQHDNPASPSFLRMEQLAAQCSVQDCGQAELMRMHPARDSRYGYNGW